MPTVRSKLRNISEIEQLVHSQGASGVLLFDANCLLNGAIGWDNPGARAHFEHRNIILTDRVKQHIIYSDKLLRSLSTWESYINYIPLITDFTLGEIEYFIINQAAPRAKRQVTKKIDLVVKPILDEVAGFRKYLNGEYPVRRLNKRERRNRKLVRKINKHKLRRAASPSLFLETDFSDPGFYGSRVSLHSVLRQARTYRSESEALDLSYWLFEAEEEVAGMALFHTAVRLTQETSLEAAIVTCDHHFKHLPALLGSPAVQGSYREYVLSKHLGLPTIPPPYCGNGTSLRVFTPKLAYKTLISDT